jgi:hypothetical protein
MLSLSSVSLLHWHISSPALHQEEGLILFRQCGRPATQAGELVVTDKLSWVPQRLIGETLPVVCIATQDPDDPTSVLKYEKTLSNI